MLEQVWEVRGFLCSKRLASLLEVLERLDKVTLSAEQRTGLLHISPATIDRLLRLVRRQHRLHGLGLSARYDSGS